MNNKFYTLTLLLAGTLIFSACSESDISVRDISLDTTELDMIVGNTATLYATVHPRNATDPTVTWASSHPTIASVDINGVVTAHLAGTAIITATAGAHTATATVAVDGVKMDNIVWATRNVDEPGTFVSHPHRAGRLFQWGTLKGVVHHFDNTTPGSIDGWHTRTNTAERVVWTAANDPCPAGWRVPTLEELESLGSGTWVRNWNVTSANGLVFGTEPNQIFLPAAGWRYGGDGALGNVGPKGSYWAITQSSDRLAWTLWFNSAGSGVSSSSRASGFSIRCVAE